jgi:hypothetical protein
MGFSLFRITPGFIRVLQKKESGCCKKKNPGAAKKNPGAAKKRIRVLQHNHYGSIGFGWIASGVRDTYGS